MSSFDDFMGKYRKDNKCSPLKSECFEAGEQSRQAEIDELKNRIKFLEKELKTSNDAIKTKSTYKINWK